MSIPLAPEMSYPRAIVDGVKDRQIRAVVTPASGATATAADFAKLVLGLQAALRRAALVVLGRPRSVATGRYIAVVELVTALLPVSMRAHTLVVALPDLPGEGGGLDDLGLDVTAQDLGHRACLELAAAIADPGPRTDPALARAVAQLADDLNVGGRTQRLVLDLPGATATVDAPIREHMHAVASRADQRPGVVHGRLVEADFERLHARLRLPDGEAIVVTFAEHLADDVQRALRMPNALAGDIAYHPHTGAVVRVDMREVIGVPEQPELPGFTLPRPRVPGATTPAAPGGHRAAPRPSPPQPRPARRDHGRT